MNKCSICGGDTNTHKFKSGYVCESCLSYMKNLDKSSAEEIDIKACETQSSSEHNRRSEEKVHGSEKSKIIHNQNL